MRLRGLFPAVVCVCALSPAALEQSKERDTGVLDLDTADFSMRVGVFLQGQATYHDGT